MDEEQLTHIEAEQQLMDIDGLDIGFWNVILDWLLFIFTWGLLVIIPVVAYWIWWGMHRPSAPVREAIQRLKENAASMPASQWVGDVNELLKASALLVFPREEIAALEGQSWLNWLHANIYEYDRAALMPLVNDAYKPALEPLADSRDCMKVVQRLIQQIWWQKRLVWLKKN